MSGEWKFKNISKNTNIVLKLKLKYLFKRGNILHTNTRNTKKIENWKYNKTNPPFSYKKA